MALQEMPIAEWVLHQSERKRLSEDHREALCAIKRSVKINGQVAAEVINRDHFLIPFPHLDLGPVRLPYPNLWIEFLLDDWNAAEAVHLQEVVENDTIKIFATTYANRISPARDVKKFPRRIYVDLSEEGRIIGQCTPEKVVHNTWPENHSTSIALMAVSLMNCSNVSTEKAGELVHRAPDKKRKGKVKKGKVARLSFHTIVLPGMPGGGASTAEHEAALARHRVRGHFKTFTPEKPLFGKLTGTYWWGWQVRGNAKNGIVETDYSLDGHRSTLQESAS